MDAPDELLVEAIAQAARAVMAETPDGTYIDVIVAEVLACSAIAGALRDAALFAEVREAWRACDGDQSDLEMALSQIMPPLYTETGKGEA